MLNTPIGSITDRELKMSYWYVTHKLAIKKWLVVLLLILTILLWFYVGWQLVFYAINSEAESIRTNRLLFSGVAGFTYTIDEWAKYLFLEKIDVTIDYAREEVSCDQFADNYTNSSRGTRLGKNDLFTRVNFKANEDLSFQYISNFEFDEDGRYNHVGSEYRIRSGLTWLVALEFFNGSDNSYYGRWKRNDRIITSLKYEF